MKHSERKKTADTVREPARKPPQETGADRLSRFIVAVVTCLGALGLLALLYFPLHYLK